MMRVMMMLLMHLLMHHSVLHHHVHWMLHRQLLWYLRHLLRSTFTWAPLVIHSVHVHQTMQMALMPPSLPSSLVCAADTSRATHPLLLLGLPSPSCG